MRTRKFNDVEKHGDRFTLIFKMDGDCNVGFVVWGSPCIRRKAQSTRMFLFFISLLIINYFIEEQLYDGTHL